MQLDATILNIFFFLEFSLLSLQFEQCDFFHYYCIDGGSRCPKYWTTRFYEDKCLGIAVLAQNLMSNTLNKVPIAGHWEDSTALPSRIHSESAQSSNSL